MEKERIYRPNAERTLYKHLQEDRVTATMERINKNAQLIEKLSELSTTEGSVDTRVKDILTEIEQLEKVGERDYGVLNLSPELAREISTIWTFSGPGTYDEPSKAADKAYAELAWSHGMDRNRLDYTAKLARKITEIAEGTTFAVTLDQTKDTFQTNALIREKKEEVRRRIREHGPRVIYNGSEIENRVVEDVLKRDTTYIPVENVSVLSPGKEEKPTLNTLDQIKLVASHRELFPQGKKVGIVSHAPHISRILRMINKQQPFQEGTEVVVFPLPTPQEGRELYAAMETEGIFWYTYVSGDASQEPYPFEVNTQP